ncbi:prolipoprotein diacylglyceryl transferase [Metamycoplasma hyosynoviae]|uniref:Phosphatidylglycerol--prolipoprotein diacylglyceryl transferase n=1 Tax=Metamycoplasma hyosynoviae TaxID=29559 RepID=A0AAP4ENI9_9BACT|nr:prolipoprotein diacylglyceryl transferase [Metamycoplasma hyosynoviae]MDC8900366.1 prolipoprotein diacylglyceryl transferase [Metamycoplasma hyosynoviae]MDC8911693.1 prolipoprotein diacylglyceryl transferase [Metamycoplasma hyosynoviae]MDC8914562.1 prolipoprotein diacylglyceryl transferase [Metamycoplasma hyosynoviae]MDC8916926.1 prolipoprotein diacylglyceryl transferase [Metamycoplasma hyosynoviae]MDC8918172.1 prolipoprotein diacylglyceryl transferase [Metamycoplasma hyosynoviae]
MERIDFAGQQLKVGPFYVYSLTMMIGMLSAILTIFYFWKREKYPLEQLAILVLITLPTALIGARMFFIIQQAIDKQWETVKRFYAIWEGGLSIHGGVIVSTICALIYLLFGKRAKKINIRKAFSIILPAVLIGQAIGRWGNFANHELYGGVMSENSLAFKILTPLIRDHMYINKAYRFPLFLYESIANLIGYVLIVWVLNFFNWLRPGTTGGIYILYYGIIRLGMEPLRQDNYTIYKVISVLYLLAGATFIVLFEFIMKLNYNVYKIPLTRNEKLAKYFYFIVYEQKVR